MLKTVKELSDLIKNDPTYGGCAVDLPSGRCIGTTSGGWQPLLYRNPEDNCPIELTWEEALELYNREMELNAMSKSHRMLLEGEILKINNFDTKKGYYTIRIVEYKDELYFHKMLNGCVVEVINLTLSSEKRKAKEV